jgi:hypothetical protein
LLDIGKPKHIGLHKVSQGRDVAARARRRCAKAIRNDTKAALCGAPRPKTIPFLWPAR